MARCTSPARSGVVGFSAMTGSIASAPARGLVVTLSLRGVAGMMLGGSNFFATSRDRAEYRQHRECNHECDPHATARRRSEPCDHGKTATHSAVAFTEIGWVLADHVSVLAGAGAFTGHERIDDRSHEEHDQQRTPRCFYGARVLEPRGRSRAGRVSVATKPSGATMKLATHLNRDCAAHAPIRRAVRSILVSPAAVASRVVSSCSIPAMTRARRSRRSSPKGLDSSEATGTAPFAMRQAERYRLYPRPVCEGSHASAAGGPGVEVASAAAAASRG